MIQKLQRFFHTDKLWGKVVFMLVAYFLFWFITYGIWIFDFIPHLSNFNDQISDWIPFSYFFIVIPLMSFFTAFFCSKILKIKYYFFIIFNILYIFISVFFFIWFLISNIKPNFF